MMFSIEAKTIKETAALSMGSAAVSLITELYSVCAANIICL